MGTAGKLAETEPRRPRTLAFLQRMRERHGDVFPLRLLGERLLIVADPDLCRELLGAPTDVLRAGEGNRRVLDWVLGDSSLMLLDGERHMSHRRLLLPALHGPRLARQAATMRALAEAQVDAWPVGEEVAALPRMWLLALDISLEASFGGADEELRGLRHAMQKFGQSAAVRHRHPGAFDRALRQAKAQIAARVAARREAPAGEAGDDILSLLLEARREDGSPLADGEICDELLTLVVAGTETTGGSLGWALERLARNPEALARTADEAAAGGGPYTDAVIHETLRMRPVVPMSVLRFVDRPFRLGGEPLPVGSIVGISALLIHHREDLYPEPLSFRPERFLERQPDTYAWIPFGGGVRRCAGASFALLEMRVVLSTLLSRMSLRAVDPEPEGARSHGNTMTPAAGARVVLEPLS